MQYFLLHNYRKWWSAAFCRWSYWNAMPWWCLWSYHGSFAWSLSADITVFKYFPPFAFIYSFLNSFFSVSLFTEGVWNRAGGLSDPEAALLRKELQQDQAEQRGWRRYRPHHGERTDPGMTWRHPFLSRDHHDSLLISIYATIGAAYHMISEAC